VFTHNQLYVEQGFTWKAFLGTIRIFVLEQPLSAVFALAMISLLVCTVENWKGFWKTAGLKNVETKELQVWVMASLAVTFLLDFIFTTLPGTNYRHYYQIPILTLSALIGYLAHQLVNIKESFRNKNAILYSAILLISLPWLVEVIGKEVPSRANWRALISNPDITSYQPSPLEEFILEDTTPDQSILVWDYDPKIYFHVDRRSPTRFIYLRHLFTPIPGASNGFAEFMQALEKDPPVLIISSKSSLQGLPYIGIVDTKICSKCDPVVRQGVVEFKHYVDQNYRAYIEFENWAVFKRLK
ncbi:MAG TPA: hypothetical protein VLD65_00035, partial [Anaerolineales bacterium]|nr:hypothetical protein [Anaerolineales bacterium]